MFRFNSKLHSARGETPVATLACTSVQASTFCFSASAPDIASRFLLHRVPRCFVVNFQNFRTSLPFVFDYLFRSGISVPFCILRDSRIFIVDFCCARVLRVYMDKVRADDNQDDTFRMLLLERLAFLAQQNVQVESVQRQIDANKLSRPRPRGTACT